MVSIFSVLSIQHIDHGGFHALLIVHVPDATSLGPPVFAVGVEAFFQTSRGPRFEVGANLFRRSLQRRHDNMNMVGPAVGSMQMPASMPARFRELLFDCTPLVRVQATRVFCHHGHRLQFQHDVGKLPSVPVFHPPSGIIRKPSAVSHPRQKETEKGETEKGTAPYSPRGSV